MLGKLFLFRMSANTQQLSLFDRDLGLFVPVQYCPHFTTTHPQICKKGTKMPTPNLVGSEYFPARLQAAMTEKSATVASLSNHSGVPESIVQSYLDDVAAPHLSIIEDLASSLGFCPGWLAFGIGKPKTQTLEEKAQLLMEEQKLTPAQLDDRYNQDGDGEHPLFNRADWIQATSAHDTLLGYWEWVSYRLKTVFAKHTQAG